MKTFISRLWKIALLSVLVLSCTPMEDEPVYHASVKNPDFPFSEAVAYGGVLYLSGNLGVDSNGKLAEGGIGPESHQVMKNIDATLQRHGLGLTDLIKCTVFLADIAEWSTFNDAYVTYFEKGHFPARSALGTSGLARNGRVEVECIAAL